MTQVPEGATPAKPMSQSAVSAKSAGLLMFLDPPRVSFARASAGPPVQDLSTATHGKTGAERHHPNLGHPHAVFSSFNLFITTYHLPLYSRGTYYLASSKRGSRQAKSWGAAEDKERDHCYPSEDIGNACCDCVEGADCDARQTTVESMVITEGWYRYSTTSAQVLKCSTPFACAGSKSANGTNDDDATTLCRAGFTGPM